MHISSRIWILIWSFGISVSAELISPHDNFNIRDRTGLSTTETLRILSQELSAAALIQRDTKTVLNASTSLDKSWVDATLFKV